MKYIWVVLILAGCATPYKPYSYTVQTGTGGYQDRTLGDGTMIAEFYGNQYSSSKECLDMATKRANEVCAGQNKVAKILDLNSAANVGSGPYNAMASAPEARVKYRCE